MPEPTLLTVTVVLAAVVIAAATDLWRFRIYNWLTFPLLAAGLVWHGWSGGSLGLAAGLLGMTIGVAGVVGLFLAGGMGAGDVKLMAGVGAWLGPVAVLQVLAVSCLAAALYSLALVLWNHWDGRMARTEAVPERLEQLVTRSDKRRRLVPFGAMIAVGILVASRVW